MLSFGCVLLGVLTSRLKLGSLCINDSSKLQRRQIWYMLPLILTVSRTLEAREQIEPSIHDCQSGSTAFISKPWPVAYIACHQVCVFNHEWCPCSAFHGIYHIRAMEGGDEKYSNPRAIYFIFIFNLNFLRCTERAPPPSLKIAIFPIHSTAALIL